MHSGLISYLDSIWLYHALKIIQAYTNQVCHLGNTTTSWDKKNHSGLKFCLQSSQGDLNYVIDMIEMKVINQIRNYNDQVIKQCAQSCISHLQVIFWEIITYIIPFVLKKIINQKKLLLRSVEQHKLCTGAFITVIRLLYNHHLQEFITEGNCLHLGNIDSHWQFAAPWYECHATFNDIDNLPDDPLY